MADLTITNNIQTQNFDTSIYYLDFTGIAGDTTVTMSGLGSGIDMTGMAAQIMDIKQHQLIDPLVKRLEEITLKLQAYSELQSKIKDLYAIADELSFVSNINALGLFSQDENIVSGEAEIGALQEKYYINVNSLATNNKVIAYAAPDSCAATSLYSSNIVLDTNGKFSLTISELAPDGNVLSSTSKTIEIDLSGVHSLYDLMNAINDEAGNYLKASYFYDGSQYRLVLTGKEGYDIDISDTATIFSKNGYQDVDAQAGDINLTGFIYNETKDKWENVNNLHLLTSKNSTNTFEDTNGNIYTIPKVTLELKGIGATSFEVAPNINKVEEKLEKFVDTYNDFVKTYYKYTYFKDKNHHGILFGDQFALQVKNKLQEILSTPVNGHTLAEIGINFVDTINHPNDIVTDSNGNVIPGALYFDKETFEKKFEEDPKGVTTLLAGDPDAGIDGVMDKLASYTFDLTLPAGPFFWEAKFSQKKIQNIQKQILRYKEILWSEFVSMVMKFSMLDGYVAKMKALSQSLAAAQSGFGG